ncbi:hypothetical protein [Lactiplantibacillus plantarum]|uniref:hypothetical protein n=1 Tax=Lactiplantibacillus plantarum TaxID=1590 RepID=UPI000FFEBDAD|nr:hypothetical protein [Lactiplantibacillus plantarum]RXE81274.1 hypothetical protein D7Y66_12775 [Lactiplantibacillus plantarum]RZN68649.1 hypothetical protein EHJ90_12775 [Lactiplantibacillus plantarum]
MEQSNNIKSFIIKSRPFGYISNRQKQVMEEISKFNTKGESFTYQYLNESFYCNVISMLCLQLVLNNIENDKPLSIADLLLHDSIEYRKSYYYFEGCNGDGTYNLKAADNRKNSCDMIVPENLLLQFGHRSRKVKKRKANNYLHDFAQYFGLELKGLVNNGQVAVLLTKDVYNKIIQSKYIVENQQLFFSQICNSEYLTGSGKINLSLHADTANEPLVLFCSNANAFINYLDDRRKPFKKIYVFGDKWYMDNYLSDILSLPDLANESNTALSLISSNNVANNIDSMRMIKMIQPSRNWLSDYEESLSFVNVHTNIDFATYTTEIIHFLIEAKNDPSLRFLTKLIWNSLRVGASVARKNSPLFGSQINILEEYLETHKNIHCPKVIDDLHHIYSNRFGAQMKKMILKTVNNSSLYAIVVPDKLKSEYEDLFNLPNVSFFSFRDKITEDMYDRFGTVVLVNPYAHERKKWARAFICKQSIILTPQFFIDSIYNSVKKELYLMKKFNTQNAFPQNRYLTSLISLLNDIKRYQINQQQPVTDKQDIANNMYEQMEKDENEILSSQEVYVKEIEERKAEYTHTINAEKVDVHKVITLTHCKKLYSTDNAYFLIESSNGILARKSATQIAYGDKIVNFDIPYSDFSYRKWFEDVSEDQSLLSNKDEKNDFQWKRAFINFINKNDYTPAILQRKMALFENNPEHHTKQYYATWSDPKKMPMLPREPEFIKYIGKLINDDNIEKNYKMFYDSSAVIKQKLTATRDAELLSLVNKRLTDVTHYRYSVGIVTLVSDVCIPDVPRIMTNKFLEG